MSILIRIDPCIHLMVIRLNEIIIYLCTKHLEKAEMNIFNEIVLRARLYNLIINFDRQIQTKQLIEITNFESDLVRLGNFK